MTVYNEEKPIKEVLKELEEFLELDLSSPSFTSKDGTQAKENKHARIAALIKE